VHRKDPLESVYNFINGALRVSAEKREREQTAPLHSAAVCLAEAQRCIDTQDYKNALPLFQKAADRGSAPAMYYLGLLYSSGEVARDYAKAREWLQKAADAGESNSMARLGLMYECGEGVAKDIGKAREWHQKAADAGDSNSMCRLGIMYEYGQGVAKDIGKAREWYQKAADAGDSSAKEALSQLRSPNFWSAVKRVLKS